MKPRYPEQSFGLEEFQDQIADWLWGTDRYGKLIFSNQRLENVKPPVKSSYLGSEISEIMESLLPEGKAELRIPVENLRILIAKKQEFSNVTFRFLSGDSEKTRLILSGHPHFNAQREFLGYRGVGRLDTVINDHPEDSVHFEALMVAVENSPNGVVITDENGVIRYTNPGSTEITGYSLSECYGQTPRLFRSGHTSLAVYSEFWNRLLQGKTWRGTVYNKHKNGEYFWCQEVVSPILRSDGTISNFVAVQEDVTFRLIAHEELKKSEERFKGFIEVVSDWYWETDDKLKISYVSNVTHDYVGMKLDDLLSNSAALDAETNIGERWQELKSLVLKRKPFRDFEYAFSDANDQSSKWLISGNPCYSMEGDFTGYQGVGRDITARNELEESLSQSKKMEEVGQRAGGIAHDFNNLLAIIMGNAELLKEKYEAANVGTDQNLENILFATKRGINIANQLLVFSRKQNLNPKSVHLDDQVSQMKDIMQSSIGDDIEIRLDVAKDLWPCYVDVDHFVNCVLNLAINSRDAMNNSGILDISIKNEHIESDVSAKDISKGDYVVFTVSDTGEGIPKENLQKVYEPFFTSKAQGKGTGLGLSMVYGFAKKSQGAIWIESEEGIGTKVHLYLPRFKEEVPVQIENCSAAAN